MTRRNLSPLRELAAEIAGRHGMTYRALLAKVPGYDIPRDEVIARAAAEWSSVEIATALGLHHTTVLWRMGRLSGKPIGPRRQG